MTEAGWRLPFLRCALHVFLIMMLRQCAVLDATEFHGEWVLSFRREPNRCIFGRRGIRRRCGILTRDA